MLDVALEDLAPAPWPQPLHKDDRCARTIDATFPTMHAATRQPRPPSCFRPGGADAQEVSKMIEIDRYPNLRLLAWQLHRGWISEQEALSIYEREWRHVDVAHLTSEERQLIDHLMTSCGNGVLNV